MEKLGFWIEMDRSSKFYSLSTSLFETDSGLSLLFESWFNIRNSPSKSKPAKTDAQVKQEISSIIRQITASCTFLPVLEEPCESHSCFLSFSIPWKIKSFFRNLETEEKGIERTTFASLLQFPHIPNLSLSLSLSSPLSLSIPSHCSQVPSKS